MHFYLLFLLTISLQLLAYQPFEIKTYNTTIPTDTECIIGADIGATESNFGIFDIQGEKPTLLFSLHTDTQSITSFADVVKGVMHYAQETYNITIKDACFAAAGVATANKDYSAMRGLFAIKGAELMEQCNLETVRIVNDVFVIGYGIDLINPDNIIHLCGETSGEKGPRAVIAAGTGLGSCLATWNEHAQHYVAHAGEGGCVEFAPHNQSEFDLAQHIKVMMDSDAVYWSWLLSNKGFKHIYNGLKLTNKYHDSLNLDDHNPVTIFAHPEDELCNATIALYIKLWGRFARNHALTVLPYGGLYIAGSVATKHSNQLAALFAAEYADCAAAIQKKLERIAVYAITDCNVRMYGAAQYLMCEKRTT